MNNRVVIIYLGDFFYDARAINMCISLLKKDCSVSVISTDRKIHPKLQIQSVDFHCISLVNQNYKKYFEFYKEVNSVLQKYAYDIIIAGDIYSLASGAKYKNKKLIYDCREIYTHLASHEKKPLLRFFMSLYERFFLKYVDEVIVTAKTDLDYLQHKYFKYKNCSWSIIYNYPSLFSKIIPVNIRQKFKIPINNVLIVYQGVLQEGRGIKQLLLLSSLVPSITAVIIGGEESQKPYVDLSKKLNINNKTVFIKKRPYYDLINYTASCDVGWAVIKKQGMSNLYALPNKLFEYALAGLPVVGANLPNIKNIIDKYNLGVIVDEKNTEQQIKAINFLLKNKKQKKYYQNTANKYFTWKTQEQKFIQIVNE